MSKQSEFWRNVFSNFEIMNEQMQTLFNTLTIAINLKINRFENELKEFLQISQICF